MRDAFEELEGKKVTVFGMSTDKPETQKRFKDKNKLPYDLISDRGGEIAKKLGISVRGGIFTARRALLFKGVSWCGGTIKERLRRRVQMCSKRLLRLKEDNLGAVP